ncbi:hypothetical protein BAUCODRAFT_31906 [Baudoinia panamericana UAMH 10762]|uniref:RRM domain-containing protein n=1 Tax=Baudoinia panamericana (strain UAMH 10762) TaxID=717646 RepID=M2MMH0_BAUPA|nr:uncharacterized protein BAUCODRAFT_31906 [Baudoinia panamericana UAMH 10762]EMC97891.1 hypothetical protein BAUCODRAFT_31906 [Baudoinia panamericana UAMH 10762]
MTDKLPPNLLALFAPRPALRYLPPADHAPEDRRTARITGVAAFLPALKEEFGDYKPTESWLEKRDRRILEKQEHQKYLTGEGAKELYNPTKDENITGDAFSTLFVGRLSYDTDVKDLQREFGRFGPIARIRVVQDNGGSEKDSTRRQKKSRRGMSRGYAFVVFEQERHMKAAYKETDHLVIRGRKVLVDVERGRTISGWRPRRFGGGLGGRHYTKAPAIKPYSSFNSGGPPAGPGGFRGGGFRGGYNDRGGFRGGRGGGGFRGGRGGIGYSNGAPDGAPAGPRSGGRFGGGGGYDDRGGARNANYEPLPPRGAGGGGGGGGGGGYRDRDGGGGGGGAGGGAYTGQKRPYDGGGYDDPRSRRRY